VVVKPYICQLNIIEISLEMTKKVVVAAYFLMLAFAQGNRVLHPSIPGTKSRFSGLIVPRDAWHVYGPAWTWARFSSFVIENVERRVSRQERAVHSYSD